VVSHRPAAPSPQRCDLRVCPEANQDPNRLSEYDAKPSRRGLTFPDDRRSIAAISLTGLVAFRTQRKILEIESSHWFPRAEEPVSRSYGFSRRCSIKYARRQPRWQQRGLHGHEVCAPGAPPIAIHVSRLPKRCRASQGCQFVWSVARCVSERGLANLLQRLHWRDFDAIARFGDEVPVPVEVARQEYGRTLFKSGRGPELWSINDSLLGRAMS